MGDKITIIVSILVVVVLEFNNKISQVIILVIRKVLVSQEGRIIKTRWAAGVTTSIIIIIIIIIMVVVVEIMTRDLINNTILIKGLLMDIEGITIIIIIMGVIIIMEVIIITTALGLAVIRV